MKRTVGIAVCALALVALVAGPAGAQQPYPPTVLGEVVVSDQTIDCAAGQPVRVSGSGWQPGETVTISWDGQQIGNATPGADGSFSVTVRPPEGAAQGEHTLSARQGSRTATARVTCVTAAVAGGAGGGEGFAFTGANITVGMLILAGLLIAGALTLAMGRRRARTVR